MRISGYTDKSGQKQSIRMALFTEVHLADARYMLSTRLKKSIEEFPREERKDVVSKMVDGCAPLFLACKKGSAEVQTFFLPHPSSSDYHLQIHIS